MAEWHYIGNYGQLGPLKEDQMQELIEVGVIESKTYVWREGLGDWVFCEGRYRARRLLRKRASQQQLAAAPAATLHGSTWTVPDRLTAQSRIQLIRSQPCRTPDRPPAPARRLPSAMCQQTPTRSVQSDKSRVAAGFLNFLPGFGRFYLGYSSIGLLQFLLTPCVGIGWIWSIIDGVGILAGACPEDGYGRQIVS